MCWLRGGPDGAMRRSAFSRAGLFACWGWDSPSPWPLPIAGVHGTVCGRAPGGRWRGGVGGGRTAGGSKRGWRVRVLGMGQPLPLAPPHRRCAWDGVRSRTWRAMERGDRRGKDGRRIEAEGAGTLGGPFADGRWRNVVALHALRARCGVWRGRRYARLGVGRGRRYARCAVWRGRGCARCAVGRGRRYARCGVWRGRGCARCADWRGRGCARFSVRRGRRYARLSVRPVVLCCAVAGAPASGALS